MGIFDKLKEDVLDITNLITGAKSPAEMQFEIDKDELIPGDIIHFEINIKAIEDFKSNKLVVRLKEIETTNLGLLRTTETEIEEEKTKSNQLLTHLNFEEEFPVYGEMNLKAGENKLISGEISLPRDSKPTYVGDVVTHQWEIEAYLEISGGRDVKEKMKIPVVC
jgi:hypothetical protein